MEQATRENSMGEIPKILAGFGGMDSGTHTEDELLGRRQHVEREGDLVLVAFALQPSDQIRGIPHGGRGLVFWFAVSESLLGCQ